MAPKGKKKGKKGKKGKKKSQEKPKSAFPESTWTGPIPQLGTKLLEALQQNNLDDREVDGVVIPRNILKHLSSTEIRDLKFVFDVFDFKSSGQVEFRDTRKLLLVLGFKLDQTDVAKILQPLVSEAKTGLSFVDFLRLIIAEQGEARDIYDEIMVGYRLFDKENKGFITLQDIRQASRESGANIAERELKGMIEEADENGDQMVDKDEFISIMMRTNLFCF